VFGLTGQAGRLFRPLAYTKTFVMLSAALLSVTVAPALRDYLIRGKIYSEASHPVSRVIRAFYEPFVYVALRNPKTTVLIGLMAILSALPVARGSGGVHAAARRGRPALHADDAAQHLDRGGQAPAPAPGRDPAEFPEVERVLGKVGRAETPTDPAPLSMVETVVKLKPRDEWRTRYVRRWYVGRTPPSCAPSQLALARVRAHDARRAGPGDEPRMQIPGWTNAFTQPIRNRVDMLTTGIRTPIGIKVYGNDLAPSSARAWPSSA
jgi:Cu(I)/Ag(I) efflux system membrane protein CusA/SilA